MLRWLILCLLLSGCASSRLTSYDVKANVGQTEYDTGAKALYTGVSAGFHYEVR